MVQDAEAGGRRISVAANGGFAFVAGEVVVRGPDARDLALRATGRRTRGKGAAEEVVDGWFRLREVADVLAVVESLRAAGEVAQPNHVLFAHPIWGYPVVPNPVVPNPVVPNPVVPNPVVPNPVVPNPVVPNPVVPNPVVPNPVVPNAGPVWPAPNRAPVSTAAPASARQFPKRTLDGPRKPPTVVVLDTGLAAKAPPLIRDAGKRITGEEDHPDVALTDADGNVHPADGFLDPIAGHGTFIAGVIEQLAPGCRIEVGKVLEPVGVSDEVTCAKAIADVAAGKGGVKSCDILNLSFGAPVLESPFLMRSVIADAVGAGILVVASAGNSGSSVPHYPAALPSVLAVGALAPGGAAGFTNWGSWVDACAPGTDLVSAFFDEVRSAEPMTNTVDVDDFDDWARWSGTSFAAPVVVAAVAREMVAADIGAIEAAERLVHAPHLLRIPGLGTVVNI